MRVIIILAVIAFTHGAKLEKTYLPPSNARSAGGSANFLETPFSGASGDNSPARNYDTQSRFSQAGNGISQFGNDLPQSGNGFFQTNDGVIQAEYGNVNNFANEARPERPRASFERNAAILRQDSANDGETFSYAFETENGIYAEENGVAANGVEAQGGFSYTGDDGQVYSVRYSAGKNGFLPQGDHFPTPPPVPEEILKALEQNARDEAAGIYDDGSYKEGKYAAADNTNYNNQFNYQQNNGFNGNDDDTVVTNSALTQSGNNAFSNSRYNAKNSGVGATYGAPNAPTFNAANSAPIFGAPAASNGLNFNIAQRNVQLFNAPTASNTASFNSGANVGIPRNSPEKAYLPPLTEREQTRNTFGRRQQSFNARTGYQY